MTAPPAGTYALVSHGPQVSLVIAMLDAELAKLPTLTRQRSDAWIRANVMPPTQLQIGYPPPGSSGGPQLVTFEESGRPILEVAGNGSEAVPYSGPEGPSQLVRAHLRPEALILTYHGLMDRTSLLTQTAGASHIVVHHRFTADRLPAPLRFDLVYEPVP